MLEMMCGAHHLVLIDHYAILDTKAHWQLNTTVYRGEQDNGNATYISVDIESKTVFVNNETFNCEEI